MAKSSQIPPDWVRQNFSYDPQTGVVTCLKSGSTGRERKSGRGKGYVDFSVSVDGANYILLAHRIAFVLMKGAWPRNQVDHITRTYSRDDDRWSNLREATNSQNQRNAKVRSDNTLGIKGVHPVGNRFRAYIGLAGGRRKEKRFPSLEQAISWRAAMVRRHHGEFGR